MVKRRVALASAVLGEGETEKVPVGKGRESVPGGSEGQERELLVEVASRQVSAQWQ